MALGEAFVNVRADLKPFAKDLEKGLKTILLAAEKRIIADGSMGNGLQAQLAKKTGQGVEDGLDDGMKKGAKKALTTGEKFFAALADFADDGLSAIPAKVKAAILIGVIAAAAVAAPFLAGVITSALTTALALGVVGIGTALAFRFQAVRDQFTALGQSILEKLSVSAARFIEPLIAGAEDINDSFTRMGDNIEAIFSQAALLIEPLIRGLIGFVEQLLPGIRAAVMNARPLIEALAQILPEFGRQLAFAFFILTDGSASSVVALRDLVRQIGNVIIVFALFIRALTEVYFWMRVVAATARGELAVAFALLGEREHNLALQSGQIVPAITDVNTALHGEAAAAIAARLAISALLNTTLSAIDGNIAYEQAMDDLSESIKNGNKSFDVRQQKGRDNVRLVEAAITGIARERDAEIERAATTGRSIDEINAKYQKQLAEIEKNIGAQGRQSTAVQDLINTAKGLPEKVQVEVETPGLAAATNAFKNLGKAIRGAIRSMVAGGMGTGGAGLQITAQAAGTITSGPQIALIGEAGREAVIPDPARHPQRAMDLSNKFGLTSMIAESLGSSAPIVNVFIGPDRLDARIDYRVGVNNQWQGTSMAYGPRGI